MSRDPSLFRRAMALRGTPLNWLKRPPITTRPSLCRACAWTVYGRPVVFTAPVPGSKVASTLPSALSRAMPRRLALPTLVKKPLTSTLPSGCTRIEKTSLSKPGLKLVSTPPDWARAGETEQGRIQRAIMHQRPVLMSLFTRNRILPSHGACEKKMAASFCASIRWLVFEDEDEHEDESGSWSQCMRKKRKEALHEPRSAAGILPAEEPVLGGGLESGPIYGLSFGTSL